MYNAYWFWYKLIQGPHPWGRVVMTKNTCLHWIQCSQRTCDMLTIRCINICLPSTWFGFLLQTSSSPLIGRFTKFIKLRLRGGYKPVTCTSTTAYSLYTEETKIANALTHSLTAALDQLRVVASSTSNNPGPRSRQHQQIGQCLLPLAAANFSVDDPAGASSQQREECRCGLLLTVEVPAKQVCSTRLSSLKGKEKDVSKKTVIYILYSTMKTEDTEELERQRAKPSKIKAESSQPTCDNCSYLCAPLW